MNLKNVLFDLLRPFGITNNYTGCSQLIRAIEIVLEKSRLFTSRSML